MAPPWVAGGAPERYGAGYTGLVQLPEQVVEDVRRRLHRAAGQLQGIERMLDEGRECRDVVNQVSAATKALEQIGFRIVAAGLTYCVEHPEEAAAEGYPLEAVQQMFLKLA
jgi:DNA-binding FrmR family transcriptional regulator